MDHSNRSEFLRPSPQPASQRTLDRLQEQGNQNNIVAFNLLREVHSLHAQPEYWNGLPETIKSEMRLIRSLAFDGFYPDHEDFSRIETQAKQHNSAGTRHLLDMMEAVRDHITQQTEIWTFNAKHFDKNLIRNFQDTVVAMEMLPAQMGGRIVSFGSARTQTASPGYEAASWLNSTIVSGTLDENGSSEQVITGAGPGYMEAANYGAMVGRWNILQSLLQKHEQATESEKPDIDRAIFTARMQMHSIGVRISLPFEAGWNKHMQFGITIKNFAPRKGALVATTIGRSVSHNGKEHEEHHHHPGVFVFPGGFGTEDEKWEAACLIQCGKMPEVPIFAVGKQASELVHHDVEKMLAMGTISPDDVKIITTCEDESDAVIKYHEHHHLPFSRYTKDEIKNHKPTINHSNVILTNGHGADRKRKH